MITVNGGGDVGCKEINPWCGGLVESDLEKVAHEIFEDNFDFNCGLQSFSYYDTTLGINARNKYSKKIC